jgi:biopolymer transport protein ExbD
MHMGSPIPVKKARIEIVPLIDVMFFLLASFMMVSLSMQRLRTMHMDLPSATAATSKEKPDMMEVRINRDGDIFLENRRLDFTEFEQRLKDKVAGNSNYPVYIKPDFMAKHGDVLRVLDTARFHGAAKVSMAIDSTGADEAK